MVTVERVAQGWSAAWAQDGANVGARDLSCNGTIRPGGSVTVGFNGSGGGANPPPASSTLNGAPCRT